MAKNWMKNAVKNPGGLHRALRVPAGKKIPKSKINAAAKKSGRLGKMARLAKTFAKYSKKK